MLNLSAIFLYYIISMLIVSEFSSGNSRHSSIAGFDVWTLLAADVVKEQGQISSTSQALKQPPAAGVTAAMPINIRGFIRLGPCLCSCLILWIRVWFAQEQAKLRIWWWSTTSMMIMMMILNNRTTFIWNVKAEVIPIITGVIETISK